MKMIKQLILLLSFVSLPSAYLSYAQEPQANPRNLEIANRFSYFLENGFEKIDLMKVPSVDKSFFNMGHPVLIIYDKNDRSRKNLLNSFTLVVEPSDPKISNKVFQMPSANFTIPAKQFLTMLPANSKITFMEVQLNTTLPQTVQQAPGSKHKLGPGILPIAFYLFIK